MFGSMLDIKPILALSRAGKLEAAAKVQGRKRALRAIVDRVAENIENPHEQDVIVIHGDVEQEALLLKDMLTQRIPDIRGIKVRMIGAVIGAHCGPGTLACCFMGRERPV
jgi:DegV family protein with EDD domain